MLNYFIKIYILNNKNKNEFQNYQNSRSISFTILRILLNLTRLFLRFCQPPPPPSSPVRVCWSHLFVLFVNFPDGKTNLPICSPQKEGFRNKTQKSDYPRLGKLPIIFSLSAFVLLFRLSLLFNLSIFENCGVTKPSITSLFIKSKKIRKVAAHGRERRQKKKNQQR